MKQAPPTRQPQMALLSEKTAHCWMVLAACFLSVDFHLHYGQRQLRISCSSAIEFIPVRAKLLPLSMEWMEARRLLHPQLWIKSLREVREHQETRRKK